MPNPSLRPAHPGQRQHPPDLLRLLVEGPIGLALSFGRNLQQFGGHRQQHRLPSNHPGEQRRGRPRGRHHGQQPHGHGLRGHPRAPELGGGPAGPERPGDDSKGGRGFAGQLRGRRHQPGPGRHGGCGQHPGLRPALRGQHRRHGHL